MSDISHSGIGDRLEQNFLTYSDISTELSLSDGTNPPILSSIFLVSPAVLHIHLEKSLSGFSIPEIQSCNDKFTQSGHIKTSVFGTL